MHFFKKLVASYTLALFIYSSTAYATQTISSPGLMAISSYEILGITNQTLSKLDLAIKIENRAFKICKDRLGLTLSASSFELSEYFQAMSEAVEGQWGDEVKIHLIEINPKNLKEIPHLIFKTIQCRTENISSSNRFTINDVNLILKNIQKSIHSPKFSQLDDLQDFKGNLNPIETEILEKQTQDENLDASALLIEQKNKIWIDLNLSQDYQLDNHFVEIIEFIDEYHRLKKSDSKLNSARRSVLKKIIDSTRKYLEIKPENFTLQLILQTALNKSRYLFELSKIRKEAFNRRLRIPKKKDLLVRSVHQKYEIEYIIHLDPAARDQSLLPYFYEWMNELTEAENKDEEYKTKTIEEIPDFFYWLEEKQTALNYPLNLMPRNYFFPEERKVEFHENGDSYCKKFGDPIVFIKDKTSVDDGFMYIIDQNGDLYLANEGCHSEIKRGENVLCAGIVQFKDGKIFEISPNSGHYAPTDQHLNLALKKLIDRYGQNILHPEFKLYYWPKNDFISFSEDHLISLLLSWNKIPEDQKEKKGMALQLTDNHGENPISLSELLELCISGAEVDRELEKARKRLEETHNPQLTSFFQSQINFFESSKLEIDPLLKLSFSEKKKLFLEKYTAKKELDEFNMNLRFDPESEELFIKAYIQKKTLPMMLRFETRIDQIQFLIEDYLKDQNQKKMSSLILGVIPNLNKFKESDFTKLLKEVKNLKEFLKIKNKLNKLMNVSILLLTNLLHSLDNNNPLYKIIDLEINKYINIYNHYFLTPKAFNYSLNGEINLHFLSKEARFLNMDLDLLKYKYKQEELSHKDVVNKENNLKNNLNTKTSAIWPLDKLRPLNLWVSKEAIESLSKINIEPQVSSN